MPALPQSIGKYRVSRRLGEGGMGAVYLAHDDGIDRDVAIKLLRAGDEGMRRRFQTEAQSAGRLKHPNIVTIYEFGEFHGEPYLVMELIEGQTLADLIHSGSQFDTLGKLSLLIQACRGLSYAHRAGVVHRDIKPSNLMVDRDGVVKIVDFGIARTTGRSLTVTGKVVGTPAYMSPEQLQGETADHRSDIFSLGIVVFEFLSGQAAFSGDSDFAVINRIVNGSPNQFRHERSSVEPLIQPVIDKALAKDPASRYPSAEALGEALERVRVEIETGVRPTPDTAPTVLIPTPLATPRSRWRAVAAGAAVVAIAIATTIALWDTAAPPSSGSQQEAVRPADPGPVPAAVPPAQGPPASTPVSVQQLPQPQPAAAVPTSAATKVAVPEKDRRPAATASIAPILAAATAAVAASDFDAAVAKYTEALAVDPANADAVEGMAEARRGRDRARAASLKASVNNGEQKLLDGAYDEAISLFELVLKTDPAHPEALDGIARARRAKSAEEAIIKSRSKKPPGIE